MEEHLKDVGEEKVQDIEEIAQSVPSLPGVYIFYDQLGYPLYVGKSVNLRARIKAHLSRSPFKHLIANLRYLLTESEEEALKLEYQLIRKLKPPFNVQYSDEWGITALGLIDLGDGFPFFRPLRIRGDKVNYRRRHFKLLTLVSPYHGKAKEMIKWLGEAFGIRVCDYDLSKYKPKGCIYYDMGICSAPCIGRITPEEYQRNLKMALKVLKEGEVQEVLEAWEKEMWELAEEFRYEEASVLRDRIEALKKLRIASVNSPELQRSYLTILKGKRNVWIGELMVSDGLFSMPSVKAYSFEEYERALITRALASPEVILDEESYELLNGEAFQLALKTLRELNLTIRRPADKLERETLELLRENVRERMRRAGEGGVLDLIAHELSLGEVNRVEGVDVSHLSGKYNYSALVVWKPGGFSRKDYRVFKVDSGYDDLRAIEETLMRRVKYLIGLGHDPSLIQKPDLIVIDGGEGQLRSALRGLSAYGDFPDLRVISIVKPEDRVLTTLDGEIREIPVSPEVRRFLARIRNEAHRFSNFARRRGMKVKIL